MAKAKASGVQRRQGDVFVKAINKIPTDAKLLGHGTVMEGEATGHAHRVDTTKAKLYEKDGKLYLFVGEDGTTLTHEEHAHQFIPGGSYEVKRQREYSPEAIRPVYD